MGVQYQYRLNKLTLLNNDRVGIFTTMILINSVFVFWTKIIAADNFWNEKTRVRIMLNYLRDIFIFINGYKYEVEVENKKYVGG